MNESAPDLVLADNDTHSIVGKIIEHMPASLMTQLVKNHLIETSDGIIIGRNSTRLNIECALYNNELSRADFFATGGVSNGFHFKADGIFWFKRDNEYGGILLHGQRVKPIDRVRKTVAVFCKSPWSVFDDRIWFSTEEDTKICYLMI